MPERNGRLRATRLAITSPVTGHVLSRDEVAQAANAWAQAHGITMAMTGNYVGKLERGLYRWPGKDYRAALRAVFGAATDADLGFAPPGTCTGKSAPVHAITQTPHVAGDHRPDEDEDMKRRQLLMGGATIGLTVISPPRAESTELPMRIGPRDAERLARRVDDYVNSEQRLGGGALAAKAQADFERARTMLEHCEIDDAAAATFLSAAGNMAVTAGWLFYDADNQPAAAYSYNNALALAAHTGDDELAAHTCLNMSWQMITQARRCRTDSAGTVRARSRTALRSTLRAADLSRRQPSGRIHALIACRQALAHASLGDRSAFDRSISTAWREMDLAHDSEPLTQCPDWLKFMSHNEVRYHQACGHFYLGDARTSFELFERVTATRAGQRNAANYRAWFAASLAHIGNTDDAIAEATAVIDHLANGVSSLRTLQVLQPVRLTATKPRHDAFRHRYDHLSTEDAGRLVSG